MRAEVGSFRIKFEVFLDLWPKVQFKVAVFQRQVSLQSVERSERF